MVSARSPTTLACAGLVLALSLAAAAASACGGTEPDIDFTRVEAQATDTAGSPASASALRIAVAPVLSALPTSDMYQQLADYLSEKLARPVELVQGKTYAEINDLIKSGDVALAIVCTNPYLEGQDDFGMELLVAPQVNGDAVYYSLLIVNQNGGAASLEDLRGASFAFSDPLSNSGRLAPRYRLARMGESPDSFFSRTIFTYSHDSSIRAVAEGVVDAAAVDSLVFEYLSLTDPALTEKVKVIEEWGPFGINPVVVHPQLAPELKERLRRVFLDMDKDPDGKWILPKLMVDRFVVPDDSIYDSVREMRSYLNEHGLGP